MDPSARCQRVKHRKSAESQKGRRRRERAKKSEESEEVVKKSQGFRADAAPPATDRDLIPIRAMVFFFSAARVNRGPSMIHACRQESGISRSRALRPAVSSFVPSLLHFLALFAPQFFVPFSLLRAHSSSPRQVDSSPLVAFSCLASDGEPRTIISIGRYALSLFLGLCSPLKFALHTRARTKSAKRQPTTRKWRLVETTSACG